jgi:hypothetical protein
MRALYSFGDVLKSLFLFFICFSSFSLAAETDEAKEVLINRVLAASNHMEFSDITMITYLKGMTEYLKVDPKNREPNNYDSAKTEIYEDAKNLATEYYSQPDIQAALRGVYSRGFTTEELIELEKFYKSDFGKHFMETYPLIFKLKIHMEEQVVDAYLEALRQETSFLEKEDTK